MARLARIDSELVRRGLARSRGHAADLIAAGEVLIDGAVAMKVARQVDPAQSLRVVTAAGETYVSRGGHKLSGALDALGAAAPRLAGAHAIDAGASTGGFTDVLLRRGASHVTAIDVGYGQLAWSLRQDERVTVLERTNVRTLRPQDVGGQVDLIVADLSFISLRLALPALVAVSAPQAAYLLLVKPQFEAGREAVGPGGVVRDPEMHATAIRQVAAVGAEHALGTCAVVASPLPGPSGNVEYFIGLRGDASPESPQTSPEELEDMIATAIAEGPAIIR